MPTLYALLPDADAVLALEPEELAGLSLELITSVTPEDGIGNPIHPTSFTHPQTLGPYPESRRKEKEHVLLNFLK
jgi:hypothetical protein